MAGLCPLSAAILRAFRSSRSAIVSRWTHRNFFRFQFDRPLRSFRIGWIAAFAILLCSLLGRPCSAQESPYIVTYDHYMEEPGSLEVEYFSTFGTQRAGNDFHAFWMEFEYEPPRGGRRKFILTANRLSVRARCSLEFAGRIASACCRASISLIRFFTSSTSTKATPIRF